MGGGSALERCVAALLTQARGRPVEVCVPYDETVAGLEALRRAHPTARWLESDARNTRARPGTPAALHELVDRRTSHGLDAARGAVVALVEDYGVPDPDWCEQVLAAHRLLPHGVIGGAVEHAGRGALNWAVYFLDFGRYGLPLAEGPAEWLTDVNVSYKREVLDSVRQTWAETYNEAAVHWELARRGVVLWRRPQMVVREDRGRLLARRVLAERLEWGRLFGAIRGRELAAGQRLLHVAVAPVVPPLLLARLARRTFATRRHRGPYLRALLAMAALATAWCLGEAVGTLTRRATPRPRRGRSAAARSRLVAP